MSGAQSCRFDSRPLVWGGVLALLVFRVWFSAVLPMTGDEGYFVFWGDRPAGGYYDHPPMVGWWLTALLSISRSEWFLRLPAVFLPLLLAFSAWWMVRPYGAERSRLAALLVILQPVNVWNVLITTDTPVILFSMLSCVAYVAGLRCSMVSRRLIWHAVAGGLLGLAFLGKYFAALLGFAYLAHLLCVRRDSGRWAGFALLLLAALPAPLYNLWWNSSHCWVNILFNFMNRQAGTGFSLSNPALYVLSVLYLASPWLLFEFWRARQGLGRRVAGNSDVATVFWLAVIPLALFGLMSLWRPVGLHWLVSFIPLLAILAAMVLSEVVVIRLVKWSALFGMLHVLLLIVILALPLAVWQGTRFSEGVNMRVHVNEVLKRVTPYASDHRLAMESFSAAAFMAYKSGQLVSVFGSGSLYARQDDFETDWRALDGRNLVVIRTSPGEAADYQPYFKTVEFKDFEIEGARFYLIIGRGFNYPVYHDKVLTRIRDRFYRIPAWLPQRGCIFCERYFPNGK